MKDYESFGIHYDINIFCSYLQELSPNTKVLYNIRSPKGKRNYEQVFLKKFVAIIISRHAHEGVLLDKLNVYLWYI